MSRPPLVAGANRKRAASPATLSCSVGWPLPCSVVSCTVLAVPWYWAEQLNALYASDGAAAPPPIGIMGNPVGGTMVEQWTPFAAQLKCVNQTCMCDGQCNSTQPLNPANQSACARNAELWRGQQQGLLNTTISGWLWYQVRDAAE